MTKTYLVIHHSLTADSGSVSWDAIRRWHVTRNGWRDIGYHLGVERVADHYEMFAGRPLLARAAAAKEEGMNRVGVHVCFVGNFDEAMPRQDMLEFAAPHLTDICEILSIPLNREHIIGHRDVASYKSCPGNHFRVRTLIDLMRGA